MDTTGDRDRLAARGEQGAQYPARGKATIVLLPGLGADRRLFGPLEGAVDGLVVPAWPRPRARESLRDFAARLASSLPVSERLYVGGASFGGMVALEIAAFVEPRGVILIGSCPGPFGIAPFARMLGLLSPALPESAFSLSRWTEPCVFRMLGPLSPEQRDLARRMAAATPASFLKWGIRAILSWRPTPVGVPVHQIHGGLDRLIPVARVQPQRIVGGAGHLLTLTHPREVSDFLAGVVSGGGPAPGDGVAAARCE